MKKWRARLWLILIGISAIPFSLIGAVLKPFSFRIRYRIISTWTRIALKLLEYLCGISYRVEGLENIPQDKAAIIFSKHQSAWETFAFQAFFPPQTWILKRELFRIPFFGWGLWALEPVAIDRKKGRKAIEQLLIQGKERLHRGIWIVIFPEGTRTAVGEHKKFKTGGAHLAIKSDAPVIPVAHNAGCYWPRKKLPTVSGQIVVKIGKPIMPSSHTAENLTQVAERWIMEETHQLEKLCKESP